MNNIITSWLDYLFFLMNKFNEGYMPPLALQKLVKYFVLF